MTDLAPHLAAFLHDYLPQERSVSRHTIASYADSLKLLVVFVAGQRRIRPCTLQVEDLAVPTILAFLESLEHERNNSVATRNVRLAGIKAFFRYLEYRAPACLDMALQVRTLSRKRTDTPIVDWLDNTQMQALLDAPDPTTPGGIRDRAMLYLCFAAGLRVSELTSLTLDSLAQPELSTVRVLGKGRRQRTLPLWKETRAVLRQWLDIRPAVNNSFLFLNARGRPMTRDGFAHRLDLHVATAARTVPTLSGKRVTPHSLRHSCAMSTLKATGDIRKVSLWLGHASIQTTETYLRASPSEKLEILDAMQAPPLRKGAFGGVRDRLMALFDGL